MKTFTCPNCHEVKEDHGRIRCNDCIADLVIENMMEKATAPSPGRGGRRPGAGRKKTGKAKVAKTVCLSPEMWAFLEMWRPGESPTSQLEELIHRAMKFWPAGPYVFGKGPTKIDDSTWNQDSLKEVI